MPGVKELLVTGRFEIKNGHLRNLALAEAIFEHGNMRVLAADLGLSYQTLSQLLNCVWAPNVSEIRRRGDQKWLRAEQVLFRITGFDLEEIFPRELVTHLAAGQRVRGDEISFVQISEARREIEALTRESLDEQVFRRERHELIEQAIEHLSPTERRVLKWRLGWEDRKLTLDEVGVALGVSRESARQIEAKAIRKLRHPERGRLLRAIV